MSIAIVPEKSGQDVLMEKTSDVEVRYHAVDATRAVPTSESESGREHQQNANHVDDEEPDEQPPRNMSGPAWTALILSVISSVFLFALDNTIVANIQPSIIYTFHDVAKLPWVSVGFALPAFATCLTWGRVYNLFDAKKLYCTSIVFFELGSAVCGAAPNLNALIVGRAIAGFGGSGIYIGTINIITGLTSLRERPLYLSAVGVMFAGGTILGPIIGGALADSRATWRWCFYINLCIAAVAAPAYLFVLPSLKPLGSDGDRLMRRLARIDLLGTLLFAGASTSLVMAITFGGSLYAWHSGQIIGLFVSAGILWPAFALQQAYSILTTPTERLFPVKFLKSTQLCILFAQVAANSGVIYLLVYFVPLYFQLVRGDSAIMSGVRLLPTCCLAVVGALVNGLVMGKYGFYMPWFLAGGIFITIGAALLHTITLDTSFGHIYGYGCIVGFGTGLAVQAPFAVAQAKVDKRDVVNVTAFISCGQVTGIVLSLTIAYSVFVNSIQQHLERAFPGLPEQQIRNTIQGASSTFVESLPPVIKKRVLTVIVDSIEETFVMVITGGVLIIVLSVFLKRERLDMAILPVSF